VTTAGEGVGEGRVEEGGGVRGGEVSRRSVAANQTHHPFALFQPTKPIILLQGLRTERGGKMEFDATNFDRCDDVPRPWARPSSCSTATPTGCCISSFWRQADQVVQYQQPICMSTLPGNGCEALLCPVLCLSPLCALRVTSQPSDDRRQLAYNL
jgi:hypothetical protein